MRKHHEVDDAEEIKRDNQQIDIDKANREAHQSVLFEPYRAFGYYTSQVPFCIYKSAEDTLIASVVGKNAFYVYNTSKLNLVFMSKFIAEEITYLQAN